MHRPHLFLLLFPLLLAALMPARAADSPPVATGPSVLASAEAFIDEDPGEGNGIGGFVAADGGIDAAFESLSKLVPLNGLAAGVHTLYVRVRDSQGVWSLPIGQSFHLLVAGGGGNGAPGETNSIVSAEYALNGGAFQPAPAADGAFDSAVELVDLELSDDSRRPLWQVRFTDRFGNVATSGAGDADGDGLPDLWELRHLGGLGQGPGDDPDGDGLSNLEEFRRGTDPNVPDGGITRLGISGVIHDIDGGALAGVMVCYAHAGAENCDARSDSFGYYSLGGAEGLEPGAYRVQPRGVSGDPRFDPDSRAVELSTRPVAGIDFTRLAPDLAVVDARAAPHHGLEFDGVDDFVRVDDGAGELAPAQWTLEAEVVPYDADAEGRLEQAIAWRTLAGGDARIAYALRWDGAHFVALLENAGGLRSVSSEALEAGVPYRVAASFDGARLRLFIDGVEAASGETGGAPLPRGAGSLWFGGRADGDGAQAFHGAIATPRLWNRARSAAEIQRDGARRLIGGEPGLIGLWRFDALADGGVPDAARAGHDGVAGADEAAPLAVELPVGDTVATLESGASLELAWALVNRGRGGVTGGFVQRVTLVADARPDDEIVLGEDAVPADAAPGPGVSVQRALRLALPEDLPAGDYQLRIRVDAEDEQAESDEGNNQLALPLRIIARPAVDLAVEAVEAPASATPGTPLRLRWTVGNAGPGVAPAPWRELLVLSGDGLPDGGIVVGEYLSEQDLAPGERVERDIELTLPFDLAASGALRLGVSLDPDRTLNDTDRDNDSALAASPTEVARALRLVLAADSALEGGDPVSATLSRSGPLDAPLTVTLAVSEAGALDVPSEVEIAAGADHVDFTLSALDDGRPDGDRVVRLSASAAGYAGDGVDFTLRDSGGLSGNLPDLVIDQVEAPAQSASGELIQVGFRMSNQGDAAAVGANADPDNSDPGSWTQRFYLSDDDQIGDDELLASHDFSGVMQPGASSWLSLPVRLPEQAGRYWIVVRGDAGGTVLESDETNNVAISTDPIEVSLAYAAEVHADIETATAGTPVTLSGTATRLDGRPAVGRLVNIQILLRDTRRVISAITDAAGRFEAVFTPLPGEAGEYRIGAFHPGDENPPVQDRFSLLGFRAILDPATTLRVTEQDSLEVRIPLENLGELPLSGLTVDLLSAPAGVDVVTGLANGRLDGLGRDTLSLSLAAAAGARDGDLVVRVRGDQGAEVTLTLPVDVIALRADLVADVTTLQAGMPLGGTRALSFRVENRGNQASGDLRVRFTDYPWLSLVTPSPLASLAPGESTEVSLLLSPPADLPLGQYTGGLQLAGDAATLTLPFTFRAVSDGHGDLRVEVVDEYFFFDPAQPRLGGATVRLYDQFTGELLGERTSDAQGIARFPDLASDYYRIVVEAPDHTRREEQLFVEPGQATERRVFISRQAVKYEWKVRETGIVDRYEITVDTQFETRVPMPVVTYDPPRIDVGPLREAGQSMQLDLKVTNHGLIEAQHFRLQLEDVPGYRITPLVDQVATLPPQSTTTIPLLIERLASAGDESPLFASRRAPLIGAKAGGAGVGKDALSCFVSGILALYDYVCGPDVVTKMHRLEAGDYSSPASQLNCGGGGGGDSTSVNHDPSTGGVEGGRGDSCCSGGFSGGQVSQTSCDECLDPALKAGAKCAPLLFVKSWKSLHRCAFATAKALVKCNVISFGGEKRRIAADTQTGGYPRILSGVIDSLFNIYEDPEWVEAFFGSSAWAEPAAIQNIRGFMIRFGVVADENSEEGEKISQREMEETLRPVLPASLAESDLEAFRDRWNRTQDYRQAGIFDRSDLPDGENPDFIALDEMDQVTQAARSAVAAAQAAGHDTPLDWFATEMQDFISKDLGDEGVCAVVKLRLSQNLVLTRQGFEASLDLNNGTDQSLTDIRVEVRVLDAAGNPANERFGITEPLLTNLDAVDGSGSLLPDSIGGARWTLAPNETAAPDGPADYFIGGTLSYKDGGFDVSVNLLPVHVTVQPDAKLVVDYFHQRDVYADDPFTDEVEPSIPYSLGVLVRNQGAGMARALRIDSGQPEIIDNEKGLLIDFDLIAAQVAGQNITPSLSLDLGDIAPGEVKLGQWFFTSTLQGHFIDYQASFTHLDPLGILTSLIDEVRIHEMLRPVRALGDADDGLFDFLVNDDGDDPGLPDTLYLSDGSIAPVAMAEGPARFDAPPNDGDLEVELRVDMGAGYRYLRAPDPGGADYRLVAVTRSDGLELPLGVDAWQTDRTFPGVQQDPVREHLLHLFDRDSTGRYVLRYEPVSDAGGAAILPIADQTAVEGETLSLRARLAPGAGPATFALADGAPDGARIDPVSGVFSWTPDESQGPGVYPVTVVARRGDGVTLGEAPFQVSVAEDNQAPVLTEVAPWVALAGSPVTFELQAEDPDLPANQLRFTLGDDAPEGATLDTATGRFSWQTALADAGAYRFDVRVTDDGSPPASDTQRFELRLVSPPTPHAGLFFGLECEDAVCGLVSLADSGEVRSVGELPQRVDCRLSTGDTRTILPTATGALSFDALGRLWTLASDGNNNDARQYLLRLNPHDASISGCRELTLTDGEELGEVTGLSVLGAEGRLLASDGNGGLIAFDPLDGQPASHLGISLDGHPDALASVPVDEQTIHAIVDGARLLSLVCDGACDTGGAIDERPVGAVFDETGAPFTMRSLSAGLDGGLFAIDADRDALVRIDAATGLVTQQAALYGATERDLRGLSEAFSRISLSGESRQAGVLHIALSSLSAGVDGACLRLDVPVEAGVSATGLAEAVAEAARSDESLLESGITARAVRGSLFLNALIARIDTAALGIVARVGNAPLAPGDDYPAACREEAPPPDVDGDEDVDRDDLRLLRNRFGTSANGFADPLDLNHDGRIDILDVRLMVRQCTRARCATL